MNSDITMIDAMEQEKQRRMKECMESNGGGKCATQEQNKKVKK